LTCIISINNLFDISFGLWLIIFILCRVGFWFWTMLSYIIMVLNCMVSTIKCNTVFMLQLGLLWKISTIHMTCLQLQMLKPPRLPCKPNWIPPKTTHKLWIGQKYDCTLQKWNQLTRKSLRQHAIIAIGCYDVTGDMAFRLWWTTLSLTVQPLNL